MADEQPLFRIETAPHQQLLILHCHGFVPSEMYRAGLLDAIQVSRKEHLHNWVLNTKPMKVIRQSDQEWTLDTWFSQFQLLGVVRLGIVVSDDIFNQMAVSGMVANLRPKFSGEVEYFQELTEAVIWAQAGELNLGITSPFSV